MKKLFKWIGIVLGGLVIALVCAIFLMSGAYNRRFKKTYDIQPQSLNIPKDSANLVEGKKWVNNLCTHCHGDKLEGNVFMDDASLGTIVAPNLTPAGVAQNYLDADWIRSIRHAVGPAGNPLFIMPAHEFNSLSAEHLGQIVAYLKTIPPVQKELGPSKLTLLAKILVQAGAFGDVVNAETIDHSLPIPGSPQKQNPRVYGAYLVQVSGCRSCHGQQLNGAPNHDPQGPFSPNLTPAGNLPKWGEKGFIQTLRTGKTPEGRALDQKFMPWKNISEQDDEALKAIYAYLMGQKSVPTPEK